MTGQIPLAFIYAAKSTADKNASIPEQLDDCRDLAREHVWEVAVNPQTRADHWRDENFTAFTGNRGPALAAVIAAAQRAAEAGREVFIVAQHTSRFARGDGARPDAPKALVELWHAWARAGIRGRTVENDAAMASSAAAAAQGEADHNESVRKRVSVRKGLRRRARDRGKLAGGPAPHGYRWGDPYPERDENGRERHTRDLEVVPTEAEVVRRIFDWYVAGRSFAAIARALNAEGVPTRTGAKWVAATVRAIVCNPVYLGKVRHTFAGNDPAETSVVIVCEGKHAAIIEPELWEAAQAMREVAATPRNRSGGRAPKGSHLFTRGLLRCGRCGDAMAPRTDPRRSGPPSEVYQCLGRLKDKHACSQAPIRREVIDTAMLGEVDRVYLDLHATRERYAARRGADQVLARETLASAQTEALRAAERLGRVQRAFQDGYLDPADYAAQRGALLAEREAAEAAVSRAEQRLASMDGAEVSDELLDRLRGLRSTVLGGLDRAPDLDALRRLLAGLFESVTYWPAECWGDALAIPGTSAGCNVGAHTPAGQAVLVPALRTSAIAGWGGNPLETSPTPRKAMLDLAPSAFSGDQGLPNHLENAGHDLGALFAPIPVPTNGVGDAESLQVRKNERGKLRLA